MKFTVNNEGFYGEFGGMFIPDVLRPTVEEVRDKYLEVIESADFQREFRSLLRDYAGRPSPLYLAKKLSRKYGAQIYLKREDLNHTGAHKINNALGQALLAGKMGKQRIICETGAGQHGVATATVCALFGMKCVVYMGAKDVARQRPNVERMRMLGAEVKSVDHGQGTLCEAINEALADWCEHAADTYYLIGSAVGPHPFPDMVAKFQSVISEEIKGQLQEKIGRDYPDTLMACVGGGSNAAGTIYHYLDDDRVRIVLSEAGGQGTDTPFTAATLQLGRALVLHGSRTLVLQDADGNVRDTYSISAGLDYPGVGPLHAHLAQTGRAELVAVDDDEALAAAFELTRLEGIIPALESSHALGALPKVKLREGEVVVLTVSGRGDKDMDTYLQHIDRFV